MLATYTRCAREMVVHERPPEGDLPPEVVWLDLRSPSPEEIRFVEQTLAIAMPSREEMQEIEASSRVYEENEALFLTATLVFHADEPPPGTTEVTFVLKGDRLVTLRYEDPQPFRTIRSRLERAGAGLASAQAVFFWLVEQVVARLADILEKTDLDVDNLSTEIFGAASKKKAESGERIDLVRTVDRIGRSGDTAAKLRESILTLQRVLLAVGTSQLVLGGNRKDTRARAKALVRDVQSLSDHTTFLSQKTTFLLEATLGLINIEQTNIIKIFSVVAVVFLPPTLIASIYGMNFEFMPELSWPWGYPFALFLMVLSAVLPYLMFKWKGWL
ncbi:MAG: magnesium/cobalt transporter CorA [Geminicoccaceae bacterium]|nr:magnesium/cobalt transporter CorA [Geminicoccaceae bacterium]